MSENENIHKGHRQRMMKKFLEHGIECFEEHEVLEILLFSSYSRRNTNDIAHELLRRFGSLKGVLNADYEDLCSVNNVGPNAAAMILFFKQFALLHSKEDFSGVVLNDINSVRSFCINLAGENTVEVAYALFLDEANSLISEMQLSRGSTSSVEFDLKRLVKRAIERQCSRIILVHNHIHTPILPSGADIATTRKAAVALSNIGIQLLDHIIVCNNNAYSMREAQQLSDIWF